MKRVQITISVVAALVFFVRPAAAGGLYVSEFGTPSMGTASAGARARGTDASTAFHNPAGMTRLDDHQFMAAIAPGYAHIHFDAASDTPDGGGNGGNQGGVVPILSSHYVHKVSDRLRFGMSLVSISGATLDPNNSWAGRGEVTHIRLFTLTAMPTLALRVSDSVSVAAGTAVTYGRLDWKLLTTLPGAAGDARVKLDGADDVAVAAVAGIFIEPSPELRFGLVYHSKTDLELDGSTKAPAGIQANTNVALPLPQFVSFDVYWKLTDRVAVLYGADWEDWSDAASVPVTVGPITGNAKLGFKDTWAAKIGFEYRLDEAWLLQTGFRYDSAALQTKDRTAALPIDRQIRVGFGAIYDWSDDTQLGMSFEWLNLGEGQLDNANVKGDYDNGNDIFFLGLNLNWKKLPWSGRASL